MRWTLTIPIYNKQYQFHVTDDIAKHVEEVCPEFGANIRPDAKAVCLRHEDSRWIIILEKHVTVPNLSHEALHLAFDVLHNACISADYFNQEAIAYLHSFILGQLMNCFHFEEAAKRKVNSKRRKTNARKKNNS
jgi:hypothetical protein